MPRGKKPKPVRNLTLTQRISAFAGRIEQIAPEWLDEFIARQNVLLERFHEKDAQGNYVASATEQAKIHLVLTNGASEMMRFAALREQHMQAKGLSNFSERGDTTNNIQLNFAPNLTAEQREQMERLYLASVSGKEVEALPAPAPKVIEAQAQVA